MDDEILGLLALVSLLIFGIFLINLRREGFDTSTSDKLRNLVRIRREPLPEGVKPRVIRPGGQSELDESSIETKVIQSMGPLGTQRGRGGYLDTTKGTEFQKRDVMKISGLDYNKELKNYTTLYENTDLPAIRYSSSRRINFEKEQAQRKQKRQAEKSEPQGVEEVQEYFAQV